MYAAPAPWSVIEWFRDRTSAHFPITPATFGRCSQTRTPAAFVSIGLNSPRYSSGASGFRSHMSMVAGPPPSHTRMTPSAFAPRARPRSSARRASGSVSPSRPAVPTLKNPRR
jgi:hypothetical protein